MSAFSLRVRTIIVPSGLPPGVRVSPLKWNDVGSSGLFASSGWNLRACAGGVWLSSTTGSVWRLVAAVPLDPSNSAIRSCILAICARISSICFCNSLIVGSWLNVWARAPAAITSVKLLISMALCLMIRASPLFLGFLGFPASLLERYLRVHPRRSPYWDQLPIDGRRPSVRCCPELTAEYRNLPSKRRPSCLTADWWQPQTVVAAPGNRFHEGGYKSRISRSR